MIDKYILIGKVAVPCTDLMKWAEWMDTANRRVKQTQVSPARISTVFLGLDHNFSDGAAVLFETMVFTDDNACEIYCERYCTWGEAEEGHERAVQWVKDHLKTLGKFPAPTKSSQ